MKFIALATAVCATKIKTLTTEALKEPEDVIEILDFFKESGVVKGTCSTSIHPLAKSLGEILENTDETAKWTTVFTTEANPK